MKKPRATKPEFNPNKHLIWSTRKIIITVIVCLIISVVGVFGFLAVTQWGMAQIGDSPTANATKKIANSKHYSNNYWGLEFDYPGSWVQPIGSYDDGEYYFASSPINFIQENEAGNSIIALKTYNNWQNLSEDDWQKNNQYLFLPAGQKGSVGSTTIGGMPAERFTFKPSKPQNNTSFWDVIIINRSQATKYVFILETSDEQSHDKFSSDFEYLLSSISTRKVESNNDGN